MKRITAEELGNPKLYELQITDKLRIVKAVSKDSNYPSGLVMVFDTTIKKYDDAYFKIFVLPQVDYLMRLNSNGQNCFIQPSDGGSLDELLELINKEIPEGSRCRATPMPQEMDSACQVRYWRLPNLFWCQNNAQLMKKIRGSMAQFLPKFPERFTVSEYDDQDGFQTILDVHGQARGVIYSNIQEVIVSWMPTDEAGYATVREEMYVYGIDRKTHCMVLKEF